MSTHHIDVVALHCDQGMGTLIRIYSSKDEISSLVLIDLGSESARNEFAQTAVQDVFDALNQMFVQGLTPRIDLVIVSHQDKDHWSLMPALLEKIKKLLPTTEVGLISYGGEKWGATARKRLREWEDYFDCSCDPLAASHSDYETPGTKTRLFKIEEVVFRILAVNVPSSRSSGDLVRNGTSAVVVVEFGGVHAILPGDATADTLGYINKIFAEWVKGGKKVPVQPCRVLEAPHHGALRTLAGNFTTKDPNLEIAKSFAEYVEAKYVVASAGYQSKFNHPYESVMDTLAVKVSTVTSEHDYVVFDDKTKKWKVVGDSKRGIYTTVLSLKDPVERTSWTFSISSTGEFTFHGNADLLKRKPPVVVRPRELIEGGAR